jgi:hypothetical protein
MTISSKEEFTEGESTFLRVMQPSEEKPLDHQEHEFAGEGRNRLSEKLRANTLTFQRFALRVDGTKRDDCF